MLINYKLLRDKHGWNPKGVIHIGGHRGEEQEAYDDLGVQHTLWFEAIPDSVVEMVDKFKGRNDIDVVLALLSDKSEKVTFNITNNGASSSMLEFGTHKYNYPKIVVEQVEERETESLKEWFEFWGDEMRTTNIKWFDTINLDVQGAELKVLKGAGDLLDNIKWIYTEINTGEVYKDCGKLHEIDEYLNNYNFKRVETQMTAYDWGDAFYVKTIA